MWSLQQPPSPRLFIASALLCPTSSTAVADILVTETSPVSLLYSEKLTDTNCVVCLLRSTDL